MKIEEVIRLSAVCMCVALAGLGVNPPAQAAEASPAIRLGAPFCDNMVLQREMKVPVWGWTDPGAEVTVEFAGQKKTGEAGKDGEFMIWLDPLKASFEPGGMTVSSSVISHQPLTIANVLVGEVWLASGQSNMQSTVAKSTCSKLAAALAAETQGQTAPIREFEVTSVAAQLFPIEKATGAWKNGNYSDYSAIAFAFAHKLYQELNVPIGILNGSWSSTQIEAWVPRRGWAAAEDDYGKSIHQKCLTTDPRTPDHQEAWMSFYASLEKQIAASEAVIQKGGKAPAITEEVPGNMRGNRDASWLYNGRISPMVPFAIRGAIWNQGWHNRGQGLPYYHNLHNMIRGWRIVWNKPELPVYFHQFYCPSADNTSEPAIDTTAEMRLGTWMARDIPNAGMASQIDIGGGIHYHNKAVPGRRLALHALKNQYPATTLRDGGKAGSLVVEGPMFTSYKVEDNKVIVTFDCAGDGMVVADTAFNRSGAEGATGLADPTVIENGEEKVKLFWLAGEDRVWHPATFEIAGNQVVVQSPAVQKPRGVSYGSAGIGFQPCLYNKALLPMTPFIQYDHEMVTRATWPDKELKIAGARPADPGSVGKLAEYKKMPLLSTQFRDNAVLQADQPVTFWGSTRNYGEWQSEPEKGDCKVHFEFAPQQGSAGAGIRKTIPVTPEMAEWQVTIPPVKAGPEPYTLKVRFTMDGELAHEREISGMVFGDVWYVAAPAGGLEVPATEPSGQIVRMIQNQSQRDGAPGASRFSICVSRLPEGNRFAAFWRDASGLAAAMGNRISAKTGRPVGIIFMQTKSPSALKNWIAPEFLNKAPSLMEDYRTIGSQYPDNPYYLANVRRYMADWKTYWSEYIPGMIETRAVPDGSAWGSYPTLTADLGDSRATWTYNVYVDSFAPIALKGVVFLAGKDMVEGDEGAHFGPEMSVLANCFKAKFGDQNAHFIYTLPSQALAPKITVPTAIQGASTAIEIGEWTEVAKVIDAAVRLSAR